MSMEEKNNIVKNFIINLSNNLNEQIPNFINEEKINKAIEMYSNSEKDIETIQNEIIEILNKMIEEYKAKINKLQEKHYELNDLFDCRISNNTLHIHVVPESIKEDITKLGLREYYKFIDEKLKDALSKIPVILQMPDNQNINTVFAVSPLLRTKESQEIFHKYGFDTSISTDEKFVEMFNGKRIGQASISRDKFLSMYQNQEQQMIENINSALSSNFMIEMLKREWDKGHNISSLGNLIGEAYNHIIINKDGYGFETYMNDMEELYFKLHSHQISPEEFQIKKAKSISFIIAQKLNIDTTKEIAPRDEEKIKQYFLNEYVKNGYVSHSFPEVYKNSIMENGLIADPGLRSSSSNEIQEIQELFMSKGIVVKVWNISAGNGKKSASKQMGNSVDYILNGEKCSATLSGESFAQMGRELTYVTNDIKTLEGLMHVSDGDWIIKGVNGEFYPCKPDIFEKTYEIIE